MLITVPTEPRPVISVLNVSPVEEDHRSLEMICRKTNWTLHKAHGLSSAAIVLRDAPISVILCDCDLKPDSWTDVLTKISIVPAPPPLIVTTRLANNALWGKVLNLGGYDVLAKPFELPEVVQAVSLAWWHWYRKSGFPYESTARITPVCPLLHSAAVGAA